MSHYDFDAAGDFSEDVCARIVSTDEYINQKIVNGDPALDAALQANDSAKLDNIDVAPNQGKFLNLLARIASAKKILEVGTLGGYSAIWLAKALPQDGQLVTLELEPEHARVAEANIKNAGLADIVDVRVGPALKTLEKMEGEGWGVGTSNGAFDLVFIDADKTNNTAYIEYALKFARVGTVIVVDNVGRKGKIAEHNVVSGYEAVGVEGTRRTFEMLSKDKRLDSTALQTIGSKGWDGFALALVVDL